MVKLIYLALVIAVLLPGALAAVMCIQGAREAKELQRAQQGRNANSVYVLRKEFMIGIGRFGVTFYPHSWAAVLFLVGFLLCLVGLVVLSFVRLW